MKYKKTVKKFNNELIKMCISEFNQDIWIWSHLFGRRLLSLSNDDVSIYFALDEGEPFENYRWCKDSVSGNKVIID